jgi:UrcA family protein
MIAPPAAAQDSDVVIRGMPADTNVRRVSYRDLNLNLIAHRKILDGRVARAVRDVCDYRVQESTAPDYRLCANGAWARARPQITRAYVRAAELAYGRPR